MKIILLGIQGSGKSTQGNLLSKKLNIPYLSTGHIFREIAKESTSLGLYIKEVMNAGYLIPDKKTIKIVNDYLSRPEYNKGYILDGFPRTLAQAKSFANDIDYVIYLTLSDGQAQKRLVSQSGSNGEKREDDSILAIRRRIDSFHKFTEPVLKHYKDRGILLEVPGEQPIEEIHNKIMERLRK